MAANRPLRTFRYRAGGKIRTDRNPDRYRALLEEALRDARLQRNVVAAKVVNAFWPAELVEAITQRDTQSFTNKAELNAEQAEKMMAALFE